MTGPFMNRSGDWDVGPNSRKGEWKIRVELLYMLYDIPGK